jgi:phospholipase C
VKPATFLQFLCVLAVFNAACGWGQSNNLPQVQHVVIVIQENRTPDNLFGSDAFKDQPQLPGADLAQQGNCLGASVPLAPFELNACFNPDHGHLSPHPSWEQMYNQGQMDGACNIFIHNRNCTPLQYPNYTYVDNSQQGIEPYFDLAMQYGYGNYFFQTNQGPSFPAHQFLLSGTSAPVYEDGDAFEYWTWFAAENHGSNNYGCLSMGVILEIAPTGKESAGYNNGLPCYNHNTLVDLLEANEISWKYYPQGTDLQENLSTSIWTAPNAVSSICQPEGGACTGAEWGNNVKAVMPPYPPQAGRMAPILSDIENCNLPAVSWVIPDGSWSDHPGPISDFLGPAWVAAIVNAVGNAIFCDNGNGYWSDTVILVVWDDWGGWYDHVLPYRCGADGVCQGYSNSTGQQYVYGFRVPFIVVSPYAKQGYISGALPPYGPGEAVPFIHDFGSILNFVEYAFGQNGEPLHFAGLPANSGISPEYAYADVLAPDVYTSGNCLQLLCPYGLSDFFDFNQGPNSFQPIALPPKLKRYDADYFKNFGTHADDPAPSDPDDDATDD